MVGMAFAALLAIKSVAHSGEVVTREDFRAMVFVKSCSDAFVPIYADAELTIVMPNPIYADARGRYSYFTTTPFGEVKVVWGGHPPIVIRNCPAPKQDETPAP
jgi:hypothetical protein